MRFLPRFVVFLVFAVALLLGGFRLAAALRENQQLAADPEVGRYIHTDLGPIFSLAMGPPDGPEVLLIHGSVGWSGTWQETLEILAAEGYFAVAIDLPPMGFSPRPNEADYGRAASAERILAVVDELGMEPHIVAHSFGAGAAVEAVMQQPDAVQSLTLIAGALPLDPSGDETLPMLLRPVWLREVVVAATVTNPLASRRLLQAFLHRDEAATDHVLEVLARPSRIDGATEAVADWLPTLLVPPADLPSVRSENYRDLTLPTALIWGAEDTTTPLPQGENLLSLIPGATLTVLPDVGHIPMIEDGDAFHIALIEALAALQP